MKKVFAITMFGTPFDWIQQYIDSVQFLEKDGWYWKIFTPAKLESKGNVDIIPMDTNKFNDLVEEKLGVRPNLSITKSGVPSVHVTDFYVFSGLIFADYLKDADYWGITNLDVVYGDLSDYITDDYLATRDIFTDDPRSINGVFSLFKNTKEVNNLCKQIPDWQEKIAQARCRRCLGEATNHTLYGTDEYDMTELMGKVRYGCPEYYPFHSHDRLENHLPDIKLVRQEDGSLWELLKDINGPDWIHARPFIGREIMFFHFQRTKKWPL